MWRVQDSGRPARSSLTLAIAGANPLNRALGPSARTVLTAQSMKPLYVPSGDPCRRDLITSGGIANVHIVTPANPPASVTAESESWPGSCPAGVRRFLTYSYATKYLHALQEVSSLIPIDFEALGCQRGMAWYSRRRSRPVASEGGARAAEHAAQAALSIQLPEDVKRARVLERTSLPLHLEENLDALHRARDGRRRDGREEAGKGELGVGELELGSVGRGGVDDLLAHRVALRDRGRMLRSVSVWKEGVVEREGWGWRVTQNETANIGVTPTSGGPMPRYSLRASEVTG